VNGADLAPACDGAAAHPAAANASWPSRSRQPPAGRLGA